MFDEIAQETTWLKHRFETGVNARQHTRRAERVNGSAEVSSSEAPAKL
jgi:hypothetical protein